MWYNAIRQDRCASKHPCKTGVARLRLRSHWRKICPGKVRLPFCNRSPNPCSIAHFSASSPRLCPFLASACKTFPHFDRKCKFYDNGGGNARHPPVFQALPCTFPSRTSGSRGLAGWRQGSVLSNNLLCAPAQVPGTTVRLRMVGITSPCEPLSRAMQYNAFIDPFFPYIHDPCG
jgi:hypothetical protein